MSNANILVAPPNLVGVGSSQNGQTQLIGVNLPKINTTP